MLTNYEYIATYTMPSPACGFIPEHIYKIIIREDEETDGYNVIADYDVTEDEDINLLIRLSSKKSIARYFEVVE